MTAPRGVGMCPHVVWVPGCLAQGWPGHPQEVGALGLHPGVQVWSRHAGCCSQLLLLQLAVGGAAPPQLWESAVPPPHDAWSGACSHW